MADSFVINAPSSGASAAGTILTEDVEFNMEITDVSITATANASSNVTVDIQKNGVSIFGQTLGTVQTGATAQGSSGSVSTTQLYVDVLPSGTKGFETGTLIQIDSEIMLIAAPPAGTAGYPSDGTSGVTASPLQAGSGIGVQRLWVTRAQRGTTAATHAANAAVTQPLPALLSGSANTGTIDISSGPTTTFARGDILTVVVGGTGATNLTASIAAERV